MQNSNKILTLDSLRGIAAFIVFFGHFIHLFYPIDQIKSFESLLYFMVNGTSSVYLFFMLSGFVLSYKFWLSYSKEQLLFSIIIRYFRLLFIVSLCGFVIFILSSLHLFYDPFDYSQRLFQPILLSFNQILQQNFSVFFTGIHADKVFWTMKVEYFGSILVFFIIFLVYMFPKKFTIFFIISTLIALMIVGSFINNPFQMGVKFLCFFVSGMLLSFCYTKFSIPISQNILNNKTTNHYLVVCYAIVFIIFFSKTPLGITKNMEGGGAIEQVRSFFDLFFYILIGLFLLVGALKFKIITNFLALKPLIFMGKISFPFYAIHSIIFGSLNVYIIKNFFSNKESLLLVCILFIIDLIVCVLLSYYIEKLDKVWNFYIRRIYWLIATNLKQYYKKVKEPL